MRKRQGGLTLVELLLVTGLSSLILVLSLSAKEADLQQAQAAQTGALLFRYENAVRTYLSQQTTPALGVKDGSAWLKNTTCGGTLVVGKEYLPCDFPAASASDPIRFGRLSLSTLVQSTGTSPNVKTTATTTTSPFSLYDKGVLTRRSDLAGISAITAASAINANRNASSSEEGTSLANAVTHVTYKADPLSSTIVMVASAAPNNDVWIRTDGANAMRAALDFDAASASAREIQGVSRIQNIAASVLMLGSPSGVASVSGAGTVVDANGEIIGSARVRNTLTVDNGAAITGSATASSQIVASNNVAALASLSAGQSVTAGNSVQAGGNVTAGGALVSQIFYDSNNTGYYLDPAATSNLNSISTQTINNSQTITTAGRLNTSEYFQLGATANEGSPCAQNGLVAKSPKGAALSCTAGIWSSGGISGQYVDLGSHSGSAILATGAKAALIQVYGGNGTSCDVWDGINRYQLTATLNGLIVGNINNANNLWAKRGYISFMAPANTQFFITSAPHNCNPGVFSVKAFTL
jgi:type II secretory pathway pseudopilin PulG